MRFKMYWRKWRKTARGNGKIQLLRLKLNCLMLKFISCFVCIYSELFQVMENNLIVILNESSALRAENARLRHAAASSRRQPAAATAEPAAAVLPPPIRDPSQSMYDRIDRPTKARCFYCGEIGHWSFLCTERGTLESRREYIEYKGLDRVMKCTVHILPPRQHTRRFALERIKLGRNFLTKYLVRVDLQ